MDSAFETITKLLCSIGISNTSNGFFINVPFNYQTHPSVTEPVHPISLAQKIVAVRYKDKSLCLTSDSLLYATNGTCHFIFLLVLYCTNQTLRFPISVQSVVI